MPDRLGEALPYVKYYARVQLRLAGKLHHLLLLPCCRPSRPGGARRRAACMLLLCALAALADKGGLPCAAPGAVADVVAGRAAREVGAVGVLLLSRGADGGLKTPQQARTVVQVMRDASARARAAARCAPS